MIARQQAVLPRKKALPPLKDGDHLDQKTFHARYEAMPEVRAQLIGGIVHMSSPMKSPHGRYGLLLSRWLAEYQEATPGTDALAGATNILGPASEPEPDGFLIILPEHGGQTWEDKRGYINGSPEWVGEISDSTEPIDLNAKKRDYEKAGVREYMVAALKTKKVFWFTRRRGKFKEISLDEDGCYRSRVFPGLWLDPAAFLRRDAKRLLTVLRRGLASAEHEAFVNTLDSKKSGAK